MLIASRIFMLSIASAYVIPLLLVFFMEAAAGPVTLPLAALRAIVWPLYVVTGIPRGVRAPMD